MTLGKRRRRIEGDGGMRNRINYLLGAAALSALVLASADAQAGGFGVREQSAVSAGDAFAGEGTTSMGLSAMFWNPAAVTQEQGFGFEGHSTIIMPQSTRTTNPALTTPALLAVEPNFSHDIAPGPAFVPAFYAAAKINPNWFIGLAIDAHYGLVTDQGGRGQASQQLGNRASIASIEGNPIVGYKVNDMVSVAAGVRVTGIQAKFNRSLFGIPPFQNVDSPVQTDLRDVGLGFTAGVTITPWLGTEFSLGYRSQERVKLDGTAFFVPNPALAIQPAFAAFSSITANVNSVETLPDQVSLGVSQRVTDTFKLLGTVEFTGAYSKPFPSSSPAGRLPAQRLTPSICSSAMGGSSRWAASTNGMRRRRCAPVLATKSRPSPTSSGASISRIQTASCCRPV